MLLRKFRNGVNKEPVLYRPLADIYENNQNVVIKLEMPGISRETLNVELQEDKLSIQGIRRKRWQARSGDLITDERETDVQFKRVFLLDESFDRDAVRAEYRDGILTVTVPKTVSTQKKRIEIQ